jgi:hypothetical protein
MKNKFGFLKLTMLLAIMFLAYNGCIKASLENTGTVKYVDVEGGFYGILSDNGQKLDPVNLKDEFKKDGLRVKFVYSLRKSGVNIHQWGKVIEIISIRKL